MEKSLSPTDIARQTLRNLAQSKIPPTPDNFRRVYDEIAGVRSQDVMQVLSKLLKEAGQGRPKFAKLASQIEQDVARSDWAAVEKHLRQLMPTVPETGVPRLGDVVRELVREMEISRPGLTISKKKEGLERVLVNFGSDADVLASKLQGLIAAWKAGGEPMPELNEEPLPSSTPTQEVSAASTGVTIKVSATAALWRDILIRALEYGLMSQLKLYPALVKTAESLLAQAKAANTEEEVGQLGTALKAFWFKLEMESDAQYKVQQELLQLLRLLVDNISELVVDDSWLSGQTAIIRDIISRPLDIEVLYDAESSLKELIYKQGQLKHSILEARETLKHLAAEFVERLAEMSEHAGEFHQKMENYQQQITRTDDMTELSKILDNLMQDTKAMQLDALRAYDELKEAQAKVAQAEARIEQLTQEIEQLSLNAQQDYLTGTLNRRGMDDAFARELGRADRSGLPLSVALLDIDHFKKLNDTLGHEAGDAALAHLAKVVKAILRPTDIVARYGGEEFVILLPETDQAEGIKVMMRVQRELTKNFFLHNNQRVLITFSAGVAQRMPGEDQAAVLKRADEALYRAKHAGRNRVFGADSPSV
ncbi:MAG: diguanylate cyclase [Methylophilaceae bacterium]|nr:diguanylate cyclase [Methylophilaceae bacterium]